jgi:hypothetical protein
VPLCNGFIGLSLCLPYVLAPFHPRWSLLKFMVVPFHHVAGLSIGRPCRPISRCGSCAAAKRADVRWRTNEVQRTSFPFGCLPSSHTSPIGFFRVSWTMRRVSQKSVSCDMMSAASYLPVYPSFNRNEANATSVPFSSVSCTWIRTGGSHSGWTMGRHLVAALFAGCRSSRRAPGSKRRARTNFDKLCGAAKSDAAHGIEAVCSIEQRL